MAVDYNQFPSPCYVLDEQRLIANLKLLQSIQKEVDIQILLALKGFAMWSVFPLIGEYLSGASASSLHEAKLCFEEMGKAAHTYAPVFIPKEFEQIMAYSSHITFNSLSEYHRYKSMVEKHPKPIKCGLRVNPEYSSVEIPLYNPCTPGTRLGIEHPQLKAGLPKGITGLHFHTLCESDSFDLEKTLAAFEKYFGHLLPAIDWINMGGGHLMTKEGYDLVHQKALLTDFSRRHSLEVILEPGSAIVWETGDLITTVLDIIESHGRKTAMLDISFTAHIPDTLEMPYRPNVKGSLKTPTPFAYRLGGMSCLSGDYMEEYYFEKPLKVGDRLIFEDMLHYTTVKTTTFNGVQHPSIGLYGIDGEAKIIRQFGYEDYKKRLS